MTNNQIWEIALAQSAVDYGCQPEDFLGERGKVTISRKDPQARKYLPLPFDFDMTEYELKDQFDGILREKKPNCFTVITFDRSYLTYYKSVWKNAARTGGAHNTTAYN